MRQALFILAETNSSGNIVWREHYTPYGEKLLNPNGNKDNQGFTGHIQDDATGLTYMQARYYDPVTGRFLSIDPVEFTPDNPVMFNRYTYVANDPVNLIDPDGREATEDVEDKDNQDERYCDNDDNCGDIEEMIITAHANEQQFSKSSQMTRNADGHWQHRDNAAFEAAGLGGSTATHSCTSSGARFCATIATIGGEGGTRQTELIENGVEAVSTAGGFINEKARTWGKLVMI